MALILTARMYGMETGEVLPPLRGEFLNGKAAVLPDVARGKIALVMMGFTYPSRFAVEALAKRFRADFGKAERVTFFEVPMIGGMARLGRWFIDSGMRRGTPKEDYEHVITVYGSTDEWKKRVRFQEPNAAYVLLLDSDGRVAWMGSGNFDGEQYGEVKTRVTALMGK